MKLSIDKNAFTWIEAEAAISHLKELKQEDFFCKGEIERMAAFYSDNAYQHRVLEIKGTVTRNGNPIMPGGEIDCWVEAFIEAFEACYRIGFYLNDFLMLDPDNREEVKAKAFIRKYAAMD